MIFVFNSAIRVFTLPGENPPRRIVPGLNLIEESLREAAVGNPSLRIVDPASVSEQEAIDAVSWTCLLRPLDAWIAIDPRPRVIEAATKRIGWLTERVERALGRPITTAPRPSVENNDAPLSPEQPGREPQTSDCCVYYVGTDDVVKIGFSKNPTARLRQLQSGFPMPLRLLGTEPGARALERARHKEFSDLRKSGEWFAHTGPLKLHIARLRAEQ